MTLNQRKTRSILLIPLMLFFPGSHSLISAYGNSITEAKPTANMVLMNAPGSGDEVVLTAWNRSEQIFTKLDPATVVKGKCVHCNVAMSFTADRASAHCSVCPCGHSFAECLTGKGIQKAAWGDMLRALPQGVGVRVEFNSPDNPSGGAKMLEVDLRSVILPVSKPLEMSDADFLALVKPIGLFKLERADGNRLLRLSAKDDWTFDRAQRVTKILAEHRIVLDFAAAAASPQR